MGGMDDHTACMPAAGGEDRPATSSTCYAWRMLTGTGFGWRRRSPPEYQSLFGALRAFAEVPGHRVVYVVGNHDVEVWWNPRIQRSLREAGWSTCRGCRTRTRSASLPNSLSTVMHGNQFHPANSIVDYANPLDT